MGESSRPGSADSSCGLSVGPRIRKASSSSESPNSHSAFLFTFTFFFTVVTNKAEKSSFKMQLTRLVWLGGLLGLAQGEWKNVLYHHVYFGRVGAPKSSSTLSITQLSQPNTMSFRLESVLEWLTYVQATSMGLAASTRGPIPAPVPHRPPVLTETPHHTTTILPAPQWTQPAVLPIPHPQLGPLHRLEIHQAPASLHTLLLRESLRSTSTTTRSPSVTYVDSLIGRKQMRVILMDLDTGCLPRPGLSGLRPS